MILPKCTGLASYRAFQLLLLCLAFITTSHLVLSLSPEPYPSDYPYPKLDECNNKVKTESDKSLFYTGLDRWGSSNARMIAYKKQQGLHIVGDAFTYPDKFVDPDPKSSNEVYFARFVDEFSTAFATHSSGEVFLLLSFEVDANNPPASECSTTWYRVEYPALKENSGVTKITQVNPADFTKTKQIWPAGSKLLKRQSTNSNQSLCLDYNQGQSPNLQAPPTGDDSAATTSTVPQPSTTPAPAYAPGTCSFHVDEYEDCEDDSKNLFANITMYDNNKQVIGQTSIDPNKNPLGDPINTSDPYSFASKLAQPMIVTGEHENDYIQFVIGSLSFSSRTTSGSATCSNGGWNPRDGPECDVRGAPDGHAVSISFFTFSGQDLDITLLTILGKPSGLLISVLDTALDNQYAYYLGFTTYSII